MRNSIRTRLAITFMALAASLLLLVGILLAWQSYVTEQTQAIATQRERAKRISIQVISYMQMRENELTELVAVRGFKNLDQDQQTQLLSELVSFSDAFNRLALVGGNGQEKTVASSTEVTNQRRNLSTADEFTIPVSNNQIYYGPIQFSEKTGEPYMVIAVPVTDVRSGKVTDVLIAEVSFKPIWDLLSSITRGQGSSIYIVDTQNRVVAHDNPSIVLRNTLFKIPDQDGVNTGVNETNVVLARDPIKLGEQEFSVVTETPVVEAFASVIRTEITIAILLLVAIVIAGVLGWFAARQIVQPIEGLVKTAQAISTGDLSQQAEVTRRDEIGTLANAFNSMTSRLRELIGSLEQRVAARTQDLAIVAEVGTATATILETDKLLQAVVDLTKERFNLYHSHIYLLDEAGENLVLASGAGEVGRQMVAEKRSIPLNREQSLVARAARERKGVTVNDVTQAPDFLPNPLLPDTRSELAVPMVVGEKVIGVFDIQSDQVGRFTESDVNIQTTMAAQVATSIQNVRSFEQSKSQADLESLVNAIGQKIQRATTVEDTLQTAIRELGSALGAARVSANIQSSRQHDGDEFSRN
jgi:putative methionine-R-sulfoxide reductase with GAF domain